MIVYLECQHFQRLRWSKSKKTYVPLDKEHSAENCRPVWTVKGGVRSGLR